MVVTAGCVMPSPPSGDKIQETAIGLFSTFTLLLQE